MFVKFCYMLGHGIYDTASNYVTELLCSFIIGWTDIDGGHWLGQLSITFGVPQGSVLRPQLYI